MTPIMCFRVKDFELWTQDYAGGRELIATCPNEEKHTWLVNCMVSYHKRNAYGWDVLDSEVN